MPKATLSFTLPDEQYEYACATHGADWKDVVYELSMLLRNALKHGHEYKTADAALGAVRDRLWEECKEYGLDPWGE